MANLLHIDSSAKGAMSVTKSLTSYFAEQWQAEHPGETVVYRDLLSSDLPFVDQQMVGAFYTPIDQQTPQQKAVLAKSNELVQELFDADTYVFGVPMYNFSVPGVFKTYLDLVVRPGITFALQEGGLPKGLLQNKQLVVLTSASVDYSVPPMKDFDFLEPFLRALLGWLGVTNITLVSAPGRDPETLAASSKHAQEQLKKLVQVHQLR